MDIIRVCLLYKTETDFMREISSGYRTGGVSLFIRDFIFLYIYWPVSGFSFFLDPKIRSESNKKSVR